jgi:hypothetical protein
VTPHELNARDFAGGDSAVFVDLQRAVARVHMEPVCRQRIQCLLSGVVVRSADGHGLFLLIASGLYTVEIAERRLHRRRARRSAMVNSLQLNFRLGSRGRNRN